MKVGSVSTKNQPALKVKQRAVRERQEGVDYVRVAESGKFMALMEKKKKFILPLTIFFLVFYFSLPILTSYTNVLERPAFGDISWAWVYATAQFIMTWVLCTVYVKKFQKFDKEADDIIETEIKGG